MIICIISDTQKRADIPFPIILNHTALNNMLFLFSSFSTFLCKCFLAHFPTNMVSKYTTESVMLSIQKSTSFLLLPYELLFVFDYNVVKAVIAAGNTAMKPKER